MDPQIIVTDDGSHTLFVPEMNEHYHSHFGAITESRHIFINAGLGYITDNKAAHHEVDPGIGLNTHPEIDSGAGHKALLEVGFGTGLNALLTALYAEDHKIKISYTSLEKHPLATALIRQLNYGSLTGSRGATLFEKLHEAPWGEPVEISEWFTLNKIQTDLTEEDPAGLFDLVYFDAFGPDKQPEMWSEEMFRRITRATHEGSVFVTYSAKGSLKRMLKSLGFDVTLLPGPPGKRVITRAVKR